MRGAPTALLASFGWAALGCAALPVILPASPSYRTAIAAAALLLFALALAAPRPEDNGGYAAWWERYPGW